MYLYTVVLDYRGGTYIRQVVALDEREALQTWSKSIRPGEILHLGPKRIEHIANAIQANYANIYTPVPIAGTENVWCAGLPCSSGLLNIIKTVVKS